MQVEVAVVADYANVAEGNKLNVMGIFDRIFAMAFPARHAYMVLAFRLRLEFEDRDRTHRLDVILEDEDGHKLGGGSADIQVGHIPPGHRDALTQVLPFADLLFPHQGDFAFSIVWNGEERARVPFSVAPPPQPPATPSIS